MRHTLTDSVCRVLHTALWLSAGALIDAREHDPCWAMASCNKLK
jgi:hypothetical protein